MFRLRTLGSGLVLTFGAAKLQALRPEKYFIVSVKGLDGGSYDQKHLSRNVVWSGHVYKYFSSLERE